MARKRYTALAFLIGAAAGGITALLLAPEKGKITRRRLREGAARSLTRARMHWVGRQRRSGKGLG